MNISGIYSITINNKIYIGSAVNLTKRQYKHKSHLNTNSHPNVYLQRAYNKYHEFNFQVLQYCDKNDLLKFEQFWIDWTKSCDPICGYNMAPVAGSSLGRKMSEEAKAKMRKPKSEAHKKALSKSKLGVKHKEETKIKIAHKLTGQRRSTKTVEDKKKDKLKGYVYKTTPHKYFKLTGNEIKISKIGN